MDDFEAYGVRRAYPRGHTPSMNELSLAEAALTCSWRSIRGRDAFGITTHPSYVSNLCDNLLSRVEPRDFEVDIRKGDGRELVWYNKGRSPPKFHAAYSSSALAVNTFSPFRRQIADLAICNLRGFTCLRFEAKLSTGVSVPNLDVLCEGNTVLAIEAKCVEYLRPSETADARRRRGRKTAPFDPKYLTVEHLLDNKFGALYKRIKCDCGAFAPVGVTQIVKHYLGVKKSIHADIPVILVYLFWEPSDRVEYPVFAPSCSDRQGQRPVAWFVGQVPSLELSRVVARDGSASAHLMGCGSCV